jgi:hypothetical protein
VRLERLGQLKNPVASSGIDPPACSIVPQPTTLPRTPKHNNNNNNKFLGYFMLSKVGTVILICDSVIPTETPLFNAVVFWLY